MALQQIQLRDEDIHQGHGRVHHISTVPLPWELEETGDYNDLVEELCSVSAATVIKKLLTVIAYKPDHRVLVQPSVFQALDEMSELII
jgi:hypothetical protein